MTPQELILKGAKKVRETPSLMASYLEIFEQVFNRLPNCAGCTFNTDFNKLQKAVDNRTTNETLKYTIMQKTFKLKKVNGTILTFKKGKSPVRMYDNRLTEDFAVAFLTTGTKKEIEKRKDLFTTLPASLREEDGLEEDGLGGGTKNPKPEAPAPAAKTAVKITPEAPAVDRAFLFEVLELAGVEFKKNATNASLLALAKKNNLV